jgi:protein ImuB
MRRVISLWLPRFATDRLTRAKPAWQNRPLALVLEARTRLGLTAVNRAAEAAGLRPGMALADARALVPGLVVAPAHPPRDAKALDKLAAWCGRYSPWIATDASVDTCGPGAGGSGGGGGLWLDATGCAHLFGGEEAMLTELTDRIGGFGFATRAAIADTPGAAWAVARFAAAPERRIVVAPGPDKLRAALAPLPVAALRIDSATATALAGLGLGRIGDLLGVPRAPLAARFGTKVAQRLDAALGRAAEPISPAISVPSHLARLAFAEPIGRIEDVTAGLERLLDDLCRGLEKAMCGARRLVLSLYRPDGTLARLRVGTARPSRDAAHLASLFAEPLDGIELGFGIEAMTLAAPVAEPLPPAQPGLMDGDTDRDTERDVAMLIDRLGSCLGQDGVLRPFARGSHIPERAAGMAPVANTITDTASVPAATSEAPDDAMPRPLRLLPRPEPVEATAAPGAPPVLFRWRRVVHLVAYAEGPERIAPEWWRRGSTGTRDYYRIEDAEGRRFWLYREECSPAGRSTAWYLHGVFG